MKRTFIKGGRYSDLKNLRDQKQAELAPLSQRRSEQEQAWHDAYNSAQSSIENQIRSWLGTSVPLRISLDNYFNKGWKVEIENDNRNDDNNPIRWSWKAWIDRDGNLKTDSSSWSGLQVVTPEQLDLLQEYIVIFKKLQKADWMSVLNTPEPDWQDYVDSDLARDISTRSDEIRNIEKEMEAAQIDDYVGQNVLLKVANLPDDYSYGGYFNGYIRVVNATPTAFTVDMVRDYDVDFVKEGRTMNDGIPFTYDYILEKRADRRRKKASNVLKALKKPIEQYAIEF